MMHNKKDNTNQYILFNRNIDHQIRGNTRIELIDRIIVEKRDEMIGIKSKLEQCLITKNNIYNRMNRS